MHPAFSDRLEALIGEVEALKKTKPKEFASHPKTKLLSRILDLMTNEALAIPMHRNTNNETL